jgi:RNA recognition motif-containing protein
MQVCREHLLVVFVCSSNYAEGGGYSGREQLPLPTKPPYTVHLGNMSFDATEGDIQDFFAGCSVTSVRIVEDKLERKPKGFGYAEFATLEGLKKALEFNNTQFQGRNIRVSVAEPRKYFYVTFWPIRTMLMPRQRRIGPTPVSLVTGLEKVLFRILAGNAVFPTEFIPLALVDSIPYQKRVVIASAAVQDTSKVTERCEILATGIEKDL